MPIQYMPWWTVDVTESLRSERHVAEYEWRHGGKWKWTADSPFEGSVGLNQGGFHVSGQWLDSKSSQILFILNST